MFNNIPLEMRMFRQWICWRFEDLESKKPTKVPYSPLTGRMASVTDPTTWTSFDEAVNVIVKNPSWYSGIGFVLTDNDPYTFIDLDDTKGDIEAYQRQLTIFNECKSYAELSPSGNGLHIIVKGDIPSGRRRSFIEIYSSQRYMTMTGNVYRNESINDYNDYVNSLYLQMAKGSGNKDYYAGTEKETQTDDQIIDIASTAANGEKFIALYNGEFHRYYSSQSEADFSLIDILAFYTQNRQQIIRIFHASELGKRDKAKRIDYIQSMLNRSFDRMLPPIDMDGLKNQLEDYIEQKRKAAIAQSLLLNPSRNIIQANAIEQQEINLTEIKAGKYGIPDGLVSELAWYIYCSSPRPVAEISLVAALGLLAGITGRAYNVSGTGLNQYFLLLAPTGTGKEAMASGISKLMAAVIKSVPAAGEFIGASGIASPEALVKYLANNKSIVSIFGEFGDYLSEISAPNAPGHKKGLMKAMLDLYNKSGNGDILRKTIYSDKANNVPDINSPSFSALCESAPEKYYKALSEDMISSGFLPRFTVFEYNGIRTDLNENRNINPPQSLIDKLASLCANALMLNSQDRVIDVQMTQETLKKFKDYDKHCTDNINSTSNEATRQLWSRAHMKALKLASILAVGVNPYDPVINMDQCLWAINVISIDVRNLLEKFEQGEIGIDNDENKQLQKLYKEIQFYIEKPFKEVCQTAGDNMYKCHSDRVIPYAFIQRRLASNSVFRSDKLGSTNAIKRAIKTMIERGDIQEVSRRRLIDDYNTTSICYMITNPKAFLS